MRASLILTMLCPASVAVLLAATASPQAPQPGTAYPPPGQVPPGAPTYAPPWSPPPGQPLPTPAPAQTGTPPAPGAPVYPGQPTQPGFAPGGPAPAYPAAPPAADNPPPAAQWGVSASAAAPSSEAPAPSASDLQAARVRSLGEHDSLYGASGLLRTVSAGSGAAGTFRMHVLFDWFKASSFLCDGSHTCIVRGVGQPTDSDSATHFGANIGLSITPVDFLEAYATIKSVSNYDSRAETQLLQVLGDTTIGAKVFTPNQLGKALNFGFSADLLFLNGAGSVGLSGGATGFRFKGLSTLDLREPNDGGVPLRMHLNLGYYFDNSGALVEDVENRRAALGDLRGPRITRVERFGLGINRVDQMLVGFGVEGMFSVVRPFIEYSLGIASNRQNYACDPVTAQAAGDVCLHDAGFSGMPSTLTLGVRAYPFLKGLEALAAFDIGTSGTSKFVEELSPTPPWDLWLGLGFAFDAVEPPATQVVERIVNARGSEHHIRGFVHEKDKQDGIANAIVRFEGRDMTGLATGPDGRFVSADVDPGSYTLTVHADGYKDGRCGVIVASPALGAPAAGAPAPSPGTPFPDQQGAFGPPGAAPGATPWAPPTAAAPAGAPARAGTAPGAQSLGYFDVDCPLEAAPKTGSVSGSAVDAESHGVVSGLSVRVVDAEGKEFAIATDASGAFHVEGLQAGTITIKADADGYMLHVLTTDVRPREDSHVTLQMNKRPKRGDVEIAGNEIKIKKQIHFETDSAKISLDSTALIEELADTMNRNPCLKQIEIQGHTDNTGSKEHNKVLSDQRANSVRDWLLAHGVEPGRLVAQGYGQDRPISPNITPAGKERNRRVQFIIKDQDKNCGKPTTGAAPAPATPGPAPAAPAAPRPAAPAPAPAPENKPKPVLPF